MEQKTINQNKLLTLLCAVALTFGILVSAVLFSVTPVHAEEARTEIFKHTFTIPGTSGYVQTETYSISESTDYHVFMSGSPTGNNKIGCAFIDPTSNVKLIYTSQTTYNKDGHSSDPWVNSQNVVGGNMTTSYLLSNGTKVYWASFTGNGDGSKMEYSGYYSLFESGYDFSTRDGVKDFLEHYYVLKDISSDQEVNPPEHNDEEYSFIGFTMNGKTARWTGTTERSYAKEVDVEEYVKVSYVWATTTEPDNLGELQAYDGEFPTSDKRLTLPWSEMENGKTDFQFIRQVKIYPCYRVPHLSYYIGQPVTIYYNADGSIDKISNPNTPGVLDESIPIPVLSVDNDNGTFLFTNAQNDYKFELKGRFWSTDDFYVFRKTPSLVWQYKYLTLLKNSLTTWVSVGDNMSTLSTYSFGDLGAESWNDLISTYPIENRNIITGEQQGWFSWANITGYNDAVTTLKTLLSTPYSLFNGYEVYVRYYVVCGDGSIRYSKWTHYFNNLADADGSTGSIVDDASNMNNGNQSDKGLTDSDIDNVENSGNSRNDVDAKPSSDFSVDISNVTELFSQFINILKSFFSGMGQLPSLINAIFGFLPSWVSAMIGVSLFVIVILRIIGR